jgi:hypothetical protein
MLDLARHLEVNLPGTRAAFRTGILNRDKAQIIANVTALLDPEAARRAEAMVLDRAGSLTPGGLRAAIQRAVMEVAPKKAQKRREHAARLARVERWGEDSGNAGLAGRELPPAQVLAADQRVSAWAKELRRAGLDGDMDLCCAPGPSWTSCWVWIPGPPAPSRTAARHRLQLRLRRRTGRRPARSRPGEPDHPGHDRARPGGPARGDERDRADRPRSRSKYVESLPERSISRPRYPAHQRNGPGVTGGQCQCGG